MCFRKKHKPLCLLVPGLSLVGLFFSLVISTKSPINAAN